MASLVEESSAPSCASTAAAVEESSLPPTERIYYTLEGNFILESTSTILSAVANVNSDDEEKTSVTVALDKSPFHPQGGGQPSDEGTISLSDGTSLAVNKVTFDFATEVVTHHCSVSSADFAEGKASVGSSCRCSVNVERRKTLSQCHSAGHLIDVAMARSGITFPPTKGYHYLDGPYVEVY